MQDPLKYFRVEAREILEQLQSGLLELERSGAQAQRTQRLLRAAHTLKGAARVVKQLEIANLAHQFEDLLLPVRDVERALATPEIEALLAVVDAIAARMQELAPAPAAITSHPPPAARGSTPPAAAGASPPAAEAPLRSSTAGLEQLQPLMDGVAELGSQLASARRAVVELGRSQLLAENLAERLEPRRMSELGTQGAVALRSLANELVQRLAKLERELPTSLERATRELGQVRDRVDQLQLVAASSIFGTLERTARDAAVSLGKQALFEADGGDLRLESNVLTAVQHALVQAVRNAVAHGIEPASERSQRGKPAEGRVTLEVRRRGRRISFVCRDDGRGVDVGRVRSEAERLGRVADHGRAPSEAELIGLLLQGGISTTTQVTEVAGRGVGLDLIRAALSSVGGTVSIDSRAGAGTSLTLEVPASLAAIEVLLVEAGGAVHALPLAAVVRALRVADGDLSQSADGVALQFDGQMLPFLPLARLLRGSGTATRDGKAWSAIVIQDGEERLALGVDRLLGAESLVARAIPDSAEVDATVAAVSLDVDGNPRLVLDPRGLLESAKRPPPEVAASAPRQRVVLVVDDSLTTRMLEQSILESAGYEVAVAAAGTEALEKARARRYDLLLVDVEMPGMDGFSVVEHIRADPQLAPTPVVLVTSRVSPADLARGRAAGANAHIAKGEFDQVDFLERIDRLTR